MEEVKKYLEEIKRKIASTLIEIGLKDAWNRGSRTKEEQIHRHNKIDELAKEHVRVTELLTFFKKDQTAPEKKNIPELFEELRAAIEFENKRNDSTRDVQHDPDYFFKSSFLLGADIFIHRAEKEYLNFKKH